MTHLRKHQRQNYSIIDNELLVDARLSFRARGIAAYLLSKPDDWVIRLDHLIANGLEGRSAIRTAIHELATLGYLMRERRQDEQGLISTITHLADYPAFAENGTADSRILGYSNPTDQETDRPETDRSENGTSVDQTSDSRQVIISTDLPSTDLPSTEEEAREADASPPTPEPTKIPARGGALKEKRIESPHIPPGTHFENGFIPSGAGQNAVQVYYERFDITEDAARLNPIQEDDLIRQCPDLGRLREAVTAYSRTSYRKGNIRLILDWYHGGVPQRTPNSINGANNGTYRRSSGFVRRDGGADNSEPEFVPDAEFLAQMERFNARRAGRDIAGS